MTELPRGVSRTPKGYRLSVRVAGRLYQKHLAARTPLPVVEQRLRDLQRTHRAGRRNPWPSGTVPIPTRSLEGWCYVYVIQQGACVKIGRAIDVRARLKQLQIASATELTLLASVPAHADLEAAIHRRFAHLQTRGEWFELNEELEGFIRQLQLGHNPVALLW